MVNRLGQIAGGLLLFLVIARLGRLIQVGSDLPRWVPILIAATLLGGVVQWLLYSSRTPALLGGLIMAIGGTIIFLRVSVPATLIYGVFPTAETLPTLAAELDTASRLIRFGIPPVVPEPALIGVLALLMWSLGAVYILGVMYNRLSLMVLPAGIIYLQFAVFDRVHAGLGWMIASATVLVLAFAGLSFQRRHQVGAVRDEVGRAQAIRSSAAPLMMAGIVALFSVVGANQASAMVSEYGNMPWRSWGGGGPGGGGGIVFDRFVDLRQRIISRENAVLFRATLGDDSPPPGSLYWRMETLEEFTGTGWTRSSNQSSAYRPGDTIGQPNHTYAGTTNSVLQRIYLERLAGDVLPSAGLPVAIHQIEEPDSLNIRNIRTARDGALLLPQGLRVNANYQLIAEYPRHDLDLGGLATGPDGQLSPLFAAAAEAGMFPHSPQTPGSEVVAPDDLDRFTRVPQDTPAALRLIASSTTRGAATNFEKAWMLEYWLREAGTFTYSTNVSTGHSSLDLVAWLLEPTSPNYRTGYCEQFAATMALLGRLLGIPSRVVWGFTPGTVVDAPDGTPVVEVRDTNAHAWVEMWMDGYGWVKFDPTPGGSVASSTFTPAVDPAQFVVAPPDPGIVNPFDPDDTIDPDEPTPVLNAPTLPTQTPGDLTRWPLYILALGLVVSIVPFMKRIRRQARLERLKNGDITAAWEEIVDRLTDMGEPIDENLTPLEFARATDKDLVPLARSYSAAVYGGRNGAGRTDDLATAELWLEMNFDRSDRLKGKFNPRSLFKRR